MSVNKLNIKSKLKKNKTKKTTSLNDILENDQIIQMPVSQLLRFQQMNHSQTSTNSVSTITHEYIGLLIEMQKIMSLKFDTLEQSISKLVKENESLQKTVENIEIKSEMILSQIDNFCGFLSERFAENGENCENNCEEFNNENNCEHCENDQSLIKNNKNLNEEKNVPVEMLINQILGNNTKSKKTSDEFENEEEYDINEKVFSEEESEDDQVVEEFKKIPKNINDLLELGETYKTLIDDSKKKTKKNKKQKTENQKNENNDITELYELDGKKYSINLEKISNLSKPLLKLNNMVGIVKVKESIFEMILYYLQGFETQNHNMLHSVVEGPPGTGKTQLGKILAQIYCALGIIESEKFKYVKATDLIGDHVGATKHMTQNVIDDADGGVLFIDEAYALSSNDNKDPYGKECIDTLNFNLSEKKKKLIVIIAGYPDQLDKYFFAFNPGLQRRFPFRHRIDGYSAEELKDIFIDKLKRFKWKFDVSVNMTDLDLFFKTNKDVFVNFGGDIENLFKKCQYAHSNRVLGKNPNVRRKLNMDDINNGFLKFKELKKIDDQKPKYPHMYI